MNGSCPSPVSQPEPIENKSIETDFNQLFVRYQQVTFTNALRICKCPHTSEEVVQEVFMKLWIKSEYLSEIKDIEGYLFMMTRNVTISCLRKQNRYTRALSEYRNLMDQQPDLPETDAGEMDEWIHEAAEQLAPRQKMVYGLRTEQRLSRGEIADRLKISMNTVRNTLQNSTRLISKYVKSKMEG
ncbi:MAG: RNA polymerase sigma factor [Ginsengibacter sp.]